MNTINIAPADRHRCAVRGLVAPRVMCSAIIVGAEFCGSDKACAHRVAAPQLAQRFDAADMATAAAQGFRDGVASLAASAGEPMFWVRLCGDGLYEGPIHNARIEEVREQPGVWSPLYLAAPGPADGESNV